MSDVTLWNLGPSPNNMKVRIALNYKGIPFDIVPVDFMDQERAAVVEVSGQPLTPVIKHGDTVVYDSRAILRYLDSNFRETPPLLATDLARMRAMEQEENYARSTIRRAGRNDLRRGDLGIPPTSTSARRASELMHEATAPYEERLQEYEFLMGDQMSVVDVTAAPFIHYATLPSEAVNADMPIVSFFARHFTVGEGREKTREWARKVMAYDR